MKQSVVIALVLVAFAVAIATAESKASKKRIRGGVASGGQGPTSGGGGEVNGNLRYGCTDPHALNWDPQANAYGLGGQIDSYTENIGLEVCRYFEDKSGIDEFSESYRAGFDLVYDAYNRRDVCWSAEDPDNVVIRWMQNKDLKYATNPITSCHVGEYFIGAIEAGDILAAPVGTFKDSEYSTGDQFDRSLYRPQDGDKFEARLFAEYLTEQHDPTKSKSMRSRLFTSPDNIDYHGVDSIEYFNDDVMLERVRRLQNGDFTTSDFVYGRPFMVGDARIGTFADLDLDGNAIITSLGYSGPNNETGGISISTPIADPTETITPSEMETPLEQAFDLDRDGMLTFWETALAKGLAYNFFLYYNNQIGVSPTNAAWSVEDLGVLKYDGVACSDEDPLEVQKDPRSQVLCFPFSDADLTLLSDRKTRFDEEMLWWSIVDEDSGLALANFNRCVASTGGLMLECLERVPRAAHAIGLIANAIAPNTFSESGEPGILATEIINPYFHDTFGIFSSPVPWQFLPASLPTDYSSDWDGVASKSCPSSHPHFIRFCHTTQTLPEQVGETIEIIEDETKADI